MLFLDKIRQIFFRYRRTFESMNYNEKIRKLRRFLDLTQPQLGEKVGVSANTIRNYEKYGVFPRKKIRPKLARALGTTEEILFFDQSDTLFPVEHEDADELEKRGTGHGSSARIWKYAELR